MVHYLMLKLDGQNLTEWIYKLALETFSRLCCETDFILDAQVFFNCVLRDDNADILVILNLKSREALQQYLDHPIHINFAKKVNPYLIRRTSFDWCK